MKLYELPREIAEIEALLDEEQEADESIRQLLDSLKFEFNSKIEWLAKLVRNEESEVKKFREETNFYAAKAVAAYNRMERTKMFIKLLMEASGTKKIEGEHLKVALQRNPPSVDVLRESDIPETYWIPQEPMINKKEILGKLKDDVEVPGCTLKYTESVRIR